jgi:hypothetical protein
MEGLQGRSQIRPCHSQSVPFSRIRRWGDFDLLVPTLQVTITICTYGQPVEINIY